jgi:hypothetical protein
MNNLLLKEDVEGILLRINALPATAQRQWGSMQVAQMLAHVNASLETSLGLNFPKRLLIGRILGSFFKKKALNNDALDKNTPTDKTYVFTDIREFEIEKEKAKQLIANFYAGGENKCTNHPHSFFGKLTAQEWAILQWKHFDHHLRQFGA